MRKVSGLQTISFIYKCQFYSFIQIIHTRLLFYATVLEKPIYNVLQDGMGKLRITPEGLRLEGHAEFLRNIYVERITAEKVSFEK